MDSAEVTTSQIVGGYLGLRIDQANRMVSREGTVQVGLSKTKFELLKILSRQGASVSSHECLTRAWTALRPTKIPKRGTVWNTVSQLRKAIRPLGLRIKLLYDLGWVLVERNDPPADSRS
jgi:DNA-binding response OmpR family regulator